MKKSLLILAVVTLIVGMTGVAYALPANITIPDKVNSGGSGWWYGAQEDQEVEPNNRTGQIWDLEAFLFEPYTNMFAMVGGFDFANGVASKSVPDETWTSGDIFINYGDAEPIYGVDTGQLAGEDNGIKDITNVFGWDYALRLNFDGGVYTWNLYAIDANTVLDSVYYRGNDESSPWRVKDADSLNPVSSGSFEYFTGLSDADLAPFGSFEGDVEIGNPSHNAVVLDLDDVFAFDGGYTSSEYNYFKFTMECGNDNLVGRDPIPEPSTLLLLGAGLIGVVAFGRKFKK
jgi:hypothetical protein